MKIGIVIVCYNPDIRTDKLIDNISNDNNYEKIVISMDEENYSKDGIKHLNIFDFLGKRDCEPYFRRYR